MSSSYLSSSPSSSSISTPSSSYGPTGRLRSAYCSQTGPTSSASFTSPRPLPSIGSRPSLPRVSSGMLLVSIDGTKMRWADSFYTSFLVIVIVIFPATSYRIDRGHLVDELSDLQPVRLERAFATCEFPLVFPQGSVGRMGRLRLICWRVMSSPS
jgi:hypothetical protein